MQQVSDLLLQEEKELQLLENEWKRYQEIHQLENVRKDLQVGQPCPCCGSTHHPYLLHMPAISSLIETQVLEKKKTVTSLREQKLTTEDKIKERVISIRNTMREIEQNQQDSANLLNQVTQLLQQVALTQLPTIQELNQQLAETDQQAEQLSSALLWAEKEETMFNIFQGAKKYISTLDQLRSKEEKRKQLFNNHPVEAIRETLQNAWLVAETELISANKNSLTLKEEEEKLQHRLSNQITQLQKAYGLAGFASLEEVQAALVADSLANEWKQQKAGLEKRKIEFNTELNARNLEQVAVAGTIDVNFDRLNLDELLGVLNNQKAEILENRGKITQQLKDNETALQTQASMRAVLEKLQQRSQLFLSLNSLIGDAGGDTFNKIVQRITLKHLLSRANVEMKKLMDRYQLLMVDNKEKNEDQIWVSDLFMGNENRSINSVSGGERFVISLALALALSDMASQNIRIDSLFIDEGFGSLSPDELNNAIQMLERMQLEGNKMLGIISHVESLKERITTQLVVEKIGPGESTLFLSTPEMKISLRAQK
jgi:exonuclease SbcC